ncbi:MAG: adenine phosphoribosyltransferase [Rickettsiales bacterium]|nr:adenine phosphoribosyltransferase [Rickettsiales bacterium]
MSALKAYIQDVPDFPKPGVTFRDITPLLAEKFTETIEQMAALFDDAMWDETCTVAGVDARGFLFASALAMHKHKRVAIIRKAGKLPPPVVSTSYELEYGEDTLQMKPGTGNVILIDDVLATGGTLQASADLCKQAGYNVIALATVIDLRFLNDFSWNGLKVRSIVQYDD